MAPEEETPTPLEKYEKKTLQKITGTLLYCTSAVNPTMLSAPNSLAFT